MNAQIPSIVPGAFYILSSELFTSYVESTQIGLSLGSFRGANDVDQTAERAEALIGPLTSRHLVRLMIGRERLDIISTKLLTDVLPWATIYARTCNRQYIDEELDDIPDDQRGTTPCTPEIRMWWKNRTSSSTACATNSRTIYLDPLQRLRELMEEAKQTNHGPICWSCLNTMTKACEELRQWLWDELPYIFGVKSRDSEVEYGYRARL